MDIQNALTGNLLGLAVGDSIGLPFEGLSPKRKVKLFGDKLRHFLVIDKGMFSDDTEHSCMVAQSLISHSGDSEMFAKCFSKKLRLWLLGLPVGIGMSTLKSLCKLWIGFSYKSSGVFSAGNGPAMRSSVFGVYFYDDLETMKEFVKLSTTITHTDPKAENGALIIALASSVAMSRKDISPNKFYALAESVLSQDAKEILDLLEAVCISLENQETTIQFIESLGLKNGVTGYMYHTVPSVIHCWLRNQNDYKSGVSEMIECGGDSDTTASILGGIIGARVGKEGIPKDWLDNIIDYPRSISWIESLSIELYSVKSNQLPGIQKTFSVPMLIVRNVFFCIVVLAHGFRRLLPPY